MKLLRFLLLLSMLAVLLNLKSFSQVPPTQLNPANGNDCVTIITDFEWSTVPNAVTYILEVADNAEFVEPFIVLSGLTATNATVEMPLPFTMYYWRVTSVFALDTKGVSGIWNFKTQRSPLNLSSPIDGTTCGDSLVTFSWELADAEFYTLQVSESSDFDSFVFNRNSITTTSYQVNLPKYSTIYYWRVAHKKSTCQTEFSQVWQLTTKHAPPALLVPTNNVFGAEILQALPFSVNFKWKGSNIAEDKYDFQLSKTINFSGNLIADIANLSDTTYTAALPNDYNTKYFWRVRRHSNACSSYWSQAFSINTPYEPVVLAEPESLATCVTMRNTYFKWNPSDSVSKYRLQISDTISFDRIIIDTAGISGIEAYVNLNLPLTAHYWRVRGEDSRNSGLWSNSFVFVTTQRPPVATSPLDGTIGLHKNIDFVWEDFGGSAVYHLQVYHQVSVEVYEIVLDTIGLTNNTFNFTVPNDNSTYFWSVRVVNGVCPGDWTKATYFKTLIPSPALITPEDKSTKVSLYPIYTWSKVADADSYEIEISADSSFKKKFLTDRGLTALTWTMPGYQYEENTTYYWRLRAKNEDGISNWTSPFSFTTSALPAPAAQLLYPADNSIKLPLDLILVWNKVVKANHYKVTVYEDADFENIFLVQETADTTLEVVGLNRFSNYWWKVQSIGDEGDGGISDIFKFRTKDVAPDKSVILISPDDNLTNAPLIMKFNWNSIERALSYYLQISTSANFEESAIAQVHPNVQDTIKVVSDLQYGKTYYWRVAARNEDGQAGWSAVRKFQTLLNTSVSSTDLNVNSYSIFPNPVNSVATIKVDALSSSIALIKVVDMLGNEVSRISNVELSTGENLITLELGSLNSGTYLYIIETPNGISSGKLITE